MDDKDKIIDLLKNKLHENLYVHALWLEGSLAEKEQDEYSDLDIWLSVDDEKLHTIYADVEEILESLAPIDFKFVLKKNSELGHNVYHLSGMSKFLSLDINTQKLSREVVLTEGIDIHEVLFDKSGVIRTAKRKILEFNQSEELEDLIKFIDYSYLSAEKNAIRQKTLLAREYYRAILLKVLEYLRKKNGIPEKVDFGFKHMFKDIAEAEAKQLESFYFAATTDQELIDSLKSWLRSL